MQDSTRLWIAVFALSLGVFALGLGRILTGCGGTQTQQVQQVSAYSTVAAACLSEEVRATNEEQYKQPAQRRVTALRTACDALLAEIARNHQDAGVEP